MPKLLDQSLPHGLRAFATQDGAPFVRVVTDSVVKSMRNGAAYRQPASPFYGPRATWVCARRSTALVFT